MQAYFFSAILLNLQQDIPAPHPSDMTQFLGSCCVRRSREGISPCVAMSGQANAMSGARRPLPASHIHQMTMTNTHKKTNTKTETENIQEKWVNHVLLCQGHCGHGLRRTKTTASFERIGHWKKTWRQKLSQKNAVLFLPCLGWPSPNPFPKFCTANKIAVNNYKFAADP